MKVTGHVTELVCVWVNLCITPSCILVPASTVVNTRHMLDENNLPLIPVTY